MIKKNKHVKVKNNSPSLDHISGRHVEIFDKINVDSVLTIIPNFVWAFGRILKFCEKYITRIRHVTTLNKSNEENSFSKVYCRRRSISVRVK